MWMEGIHNFEFFDFNDPGLIAYHPGYDLFGVLGILRFDNCLTGVDPVVTSPIELVQITGGVDFLDDLIAVLRSVGRFNQIPIHGYSPIINLPLLK